MTDTETARQAELVELFRSDGTLSSRGLIENYCREGIWEYYNSSGIKTAVENYHNGLKHGVSKHRDPTATFKEVESFYLFGVPHGKWTFYRRDTTIRKFITYNNGKEEGPYFEDFSDTYVHGQLKDSRRVGVWEWYKKIDIFTPDILFKRMYYNDDGTCARISYYHDNGSIKEMTNGGDEDCHRNGTWAFCNPEGKITHVYTFRHTSYPLGFARYYNPDGSVREEGMYDETGRVGVWHRY